MPDTRIKVYRNDFPSREVTEKMKLGEKFMWMPDDEMKRMGVSPTLYIIERHTFEGSRRPVTVAMPYTMPSVHVLQHG